VSSADFDLLVVGGGMAGMSAAAEAACRGARVVVSEVADRLGGTALLSTGNVWTVQTPEAFRQADPDGDQTLWQVVRDDLEDSLEWVASLGVAVHERHRASSSSTYDPPPVGRNVDIEAYMVRSRRAVESAGGWVLNGTTVVDLHTSGSAVVGGRIQTVTTRDGLDIQARGVVLASGGFQGSPDLRAHYLGKAVADSVAVRSNPDSQGIALTLGLRAGASTSPRMDTFYGVILPAVAGTISEGDYRGLVIHAAAFGGVVVVGADGRRLTDESAGAVALANAVARTGRALFIVGPEMVRAAHERLGTDLTDLVRTANVRGARCVTADCVRSLARTVTEWGYDGTATQATIEQFDRAMRGDGSTSLPRARHRLAVGDGPVSVLEVQAAITSTFGGLRTDTDGQVLKGDGSTLPGLFAAGVDQGGYNVSGYVGGLSRALVYGRRAARKALSHV
jgi:succinate dehydrogenase/fumarate reductase flavoprotein subunit